MVLKAECAWARKCVRKTKELCSSLKKAPGEGSAKFCTRVLTERHKCYSEHFKEYPQFTLNQCDFNRVSKVINEKISSWRNKEDKAVYLSMVNWDESITKEMKTAHSLNN